MSATNPRSRVYRLTRAESIGVARATLREPPAADHINRVEPTGFLIATFILPLEMLASNASRHGVAWKHAAGKQDVWIELWKQNGCRKQVQPLAGRPFVRCVRFSSSRPDRGNDGFKVAIDRLCVDRFRLNRKKGTRKRIDGLGYLADDNEAAADICCWWEPAAPGRGFGLVEVWTGS